MGKYFHNGKKARTTEVPIALHPLPADQWFVCTDCEAGPFQEKFRFMHWYDNAHLSYKLVDAPADGIEQPWSCNPKWERAQAEIREANDYYGKGGTLL